MVLSVMLVQVLIISNTNLEDWKEIGVFHRLHGSESLLMIVPTTRHTNSLPELSLTSATCPGSQGPRDLLSAGSRCGQTSPTSCENVGPKCLRTEGRVQSDICRDTRRVPQSRAPWRSSPTDRSCRV